MKIWQKRDNGLIFLGEGSIFSKKQLRLKEDVDANIGTASGIQQAQAKAKQLMNKNPSVTTASADAGKMDGQNDASTGEGMSINVPVNANGQQLAAVQQMTKDQGADDVQVKFTKDDTSSDTTNESRVANLRNNSVPFTKAEMSAFLNSL